MPRQRSPEEARAYMASYRARRKTETATQVETDRLAELRAKPVGERTMAEKEELAALIRADDDRRFPPLATQIANLPQAYKDAILERVNTKTRKADW